MNTTMTARLSISFAPDGGINLLLAPGIPFEQTLMLLNLLATHYPGRLVTVVTIDTWGEPCTS